MADSALGMESEVPGLIPVIPSCRIWVSTLDKETPAIQI